MTRLSRPWLAVALWIVAPAVAAAQQPTPHVGRPPEGPGFLTSGRFHLGVEALANSDVRYDWDADIGGEIDVVDYGAGRLNVSFNYETVMGGVLQPFDPIFNNYLIDVLATARLSGVEIGAKFEHVSRHLGDRAKDYGIAWNSLGAEAIWRGGEGRLAWQARARALAMVYRGSVDYTAEYGADLAWRYAWRPRAAVIGSGMVRVLGIDDELSDRDAPVGARAEAGVQFPGKYAALELFVAVERRIDPDPLAPRAETWAVAGFRVVNR